RAGLLRADRAHRRAGGGHPGLRASRPPRRRARHRDDACRDPRRVRRTRPLDRRRRRGPPAAPLRTSRLQARVQDDGAHVVAMIARPPETRFLLAKRTAMVAATAFLAINLWTGAPLIALWVGSQVVGKTVLSMEAVMVVVVVLAVLVFSMSMALAWLSSEYDRLSGREPGEHRLPWMRGMSGEEGIEQPGYGAGITPLER